MKLGEFIKERLLYLVLLIIIIGTILIFLMPYNVEPLIIAYIVLLPTIIYIICCISEYIKKKSYYDYLENNMDKLEEKYLISEILPEANFVEGRLLKETLKQTGKSMIENVNKYKFAVEDYKDYIEMWIHEIKIPIATSKLIIENNKSDITKSIDEEINKMENYIEQVLFYARSNAVEKDYIINKSSLKEIVNSAVIRNKEWILNNNIKLNLHDLEKKVYTDSKWCIFIINQIIQNSIKYSKKDNKEIEIYAEENKNNVSLIIKDNGIGINEKDISRVFEKGFTGENGRLIGKKSTGIGLYLCKKLCDKLDLGIQIASNLQDGTTVTLTFPVNSLVEMKSK